MKSAVLYLTTQKHLELLYYFYEHHNKPFIRHAVVSKFCNSKSPVHASYYLRKIQDYGLVEQVRSKITGQSLGYKISPTGIFYFKWCLKLEKELE